MNTSKTCLTVFCVGMCLADGAFARTLDELPVGKGGNPVGVWEADSLEIDVYASPALLSAVSDFVLTGFVDGQISVDAQGGYVSSCVVGVDVSLTFMGGPLAVSFKDTVSESGTVHLADSLLVLTHASLIDTLAYTVSSDTLSLIQDIPLGEFGTLVASIDPDGGPLLSVLHLAKVDINGKTADFDGDGTVGFSDFLNFAGNFGKQSSDVDFDSRFDLDADGIVGFTDFLVFISQFG
ncbi:MAG: EF-hand domain-containing protein [Candidatus Latescibacterota bacterium]|nr:EF-hand domain-containing protein [Candidatus Latescibacterota bacterium]